MRSTNGAARHKKHKKIMNRVSGFYQSRHKQYRTARAAIKRAEQQAFIGRKLKKRDMRKLWITRINIASRELGVPYSRLMSGLTKAGITIDRKQLSELAIHQPEAFKALVDQAVAANS